MLPLFPKNVCERMCKEVVGVDGVYCAGHLGLMPKSPLKLVLDKKSSDICNADMFVKKCVKGHFHLLTNPQSFPVPNPQLRPSTTTTIMSCSKT